MIHYAFFMLPVLERFGLTNPANLIPVFLALLRIAGILVIGLLALRLVNSGLKRIWGIVPSGDQTHSTRIENRTETLRHIVGSVGKIVLWGVVILMIFKEFYDITPLLTGVGILGLAVGFGAQALVKDFISGFFILLEDQYGVGDSVRIGDHDGVVEHMTLRTTILRNFEGHVHVIPNGSVTSVSVLTRDWARAVVDITVTPAVEIGPLFRVLDETGGRLSSEMKDAIIDRPQILGIEKLTEEGVTLRLAVKTYPLKRADVSRQWRKMIKEALERDGIELASKKGI